MATLNDVAREAGVSPTAVSRHLNRSIELPQATRDRIDAAVKKLDYRPNVLAKRLSMGKAEVIGLVAPEIANPFFAELAAAVEEEAAKRGYGVYLTSTRGDRSREVDALSRLSDQYVDGLIMITNQPDDGTLSAMLAQHENVVLLDEDVAGVSVPRVFVENASGTFMATEHLIANGHRDIVVVSGPEDLFTVGERLAGHREALDAHGICYRPERALFGAYSRDFGYEAAFRVARMTPRPTAVLACSDYIAIGMLQGFRELGLGVPEDISLVGFDDMPFASLIDPALTTIRQPIAEMGKLALDRLLAVLDGSGDTSVTRLPVTLVERLSVAKLDGKTDK